jgi:hypothetical protein
MLKLNVNEPKVKIPPKTVDIIGLTERQAGQLLSLLGQTSGEDDLDELYELYDMLKGNIKPVGRYYCEKYSIFYEEK